jgi:hypothetical protein
MQEQNANTANKLQFIIRLNLIKNAKDWEIPDFAEAIGATIPCRGYFILYNLLIINILPFFS